MQTDKKEETKKQVWRRPALIDLDHNQTKASKNYDVFEHGGTGGRTYGTS